MINITLLDNIIEKERKVYAQKHPQSFKAYQQAHHLLGKVPMTWMNKWSGGFPLYMAKAKGNKIIDIDGN